MKSFLQITFILFVGLFFSCKSTKNTLNRVEQDDTKLTKKETFADLSKKTIDTTKTEKGKITITEIEFFPPNYGGAEPGVDNNKIDPSKIPKQGVNNAIKSIKQTTIESEKEENGQSEETQSSNITNDEAMVSHSRKDIQQEIAPAPDPYKWRYIFYLSLLIVGVLLYLNRTTVVRTIKNFFKRRI